jgi:sugar phosphate isomerase/epimerase
MQDNTLRVASYSTGGLTDRPLAAALETIVAAGFSQAEVLGGGRRRHVSIPPPVGEELVALRAILDRSGLTGWTTHAPDALGAPDEETRRRRVNLMQAFLLFCGKVEAERVVVHAVPNPRGVPDAAEPRAQQALRDSVVRSLDEVLPVAERAGVQIMLENLPYYEAPGYPLITMRELRPFVDGYPEAWVGLVLDTGHVGTLKGDVVAEITTAGSRLWGTHLQDVPAENPNDQHWPPTHGSLDWDAVRRALTDVDYAGAWTFEVANGRNGETPDDLVRICHRVACDWGLD